MKKLTLTLLAAAGLLLFSTANSNAGVHFGIFVGPPPPPPVYYPPPPVYYGGYSPDYGYGYRHYRHRPHYYYRGGYRSYHP